LDHAGAELLAVDNDRHNIAGERKFIHVLLRDGQITDEIGDVSSAT